MQGCKSVDHVICQIYNVFFNGSVGKDIGLVIIVQERAHFGQGVGVLVSEEVPA